MNDRNTNEIRGYVTCDARLKSEKKRDGAENLGLPEGRSFYNFFYFNTLQSFSFYFK